MGLLRVGCMALVLGGALLARADETRIAKEHYSRGITLYDLGRFADAAAEFEAAYEARSDSALLFNIGQAHRMSGKYQKALLAYRAYLRHAPDAAHRALANNNIAELERLVKQQQRASEAPPTGTIAPADGTNSAETATKPDGPKSNTAANAALAVEQKRSDVPPEKTAPTYKKWWLWTAVGAVAVGVGLGLGLGLGLDSGQSAPVLPAVGP